MPRVELEGWRHVSHVPAAWACCSNDLKISGARHVFITDLIGTVGTSIHGVGFTLGTVRVKLTSNTI